MKSKRTHKQRGKTSNKRHFLSVFAHLFLLPLSTKAEVDVALSVFWDEVFSFRVNIFFTESMQILSFCLLRTVLEYRLSVLRIILFFKITKAFGVLHLECLTASVPSS